MISAVLIISGCSAAPGPEAVDALEAAVEDGLSMGLFTTQTLGGEEVTQEIFQNAELSLVNVWATWCGPCLQELPGLEAISRSENGTDFQVIGIVHDLYDPETGETDRDAFETADYIKGEMALTFTNLIPDAALYDGILSTLYAFPTTFFVDSAGNVIGDPVVGSQSEQQWKQTIADMKAEAGL